MENEYRNAMDKIKADEKFKAQLKATLAQKQASVKEERKLSFPTLRRPLIASLSSAAVFALMIYVSLAVVLPSLRHDPSDLESGKPGTVYNGRTPKPKETVQPDDNTDEYSVSVQAPAEIRVSEDGLLETPLGAVPDEEKMGGAAASNETKAETETEQLPQSYAIVSHAEQHDIAAKGESTDETVYYYDSTFHFRFYGFEKYGKTLEANDMVFNVELSGEYTISDLISDYYSTIIGKNGPLRLRDGLLDVFLDVPACGRRQINLYVNGVEVVNLDNVRLCEFHGEQDVYFTIVVT